MPFPSPLRWSRLALSLTAGGLAVGLAMVAVAASPERRGPAEDSLEALVEREKELDWAAKKVRARIARKVWIAQEVIAGRIRLLEAAGRFRALDQLPPQVSL